MTAKVEKRREFLINLLFLAAILALVYVFFKYLFWVTAPFMLTFLLAILLQKPIRALDSKCKRKMHTFWSIFLVIAVVLVVLVPLGFIVSALVSRISEIVKYAVSQLNDIPTFLATLENEILNMTKFLPEGIYNSFSETVTDTFSKLIDDFDLSAIGLNMSSLKTGVSSGISGVMGVVKNIPSVALGIIIGIIACILFTKDYDKIVKFIQLQFPEGKKNLPVELKQVFTKTILKMVRAYGIIMCITFGELFIGFTIMRVAGALTTSYYIWIALAITVFDIMPIAGSGGILVPWALVALIMGNFKQALGLVVIYVVITVIRQYIEPKIVGDSLGVNPIITLMGLYFGLKLFGFIGMFIVPITVMTLKAFNDTGRIHLWKTADRK